MCKEEIGEAITRDCEGVDQLFSDPPRHVADAGRRSVGEATERFPRAAGLAKHRKLRIEDGRRSPSPAFWRGA
jgi:hypothetical protein